MAASKTIYILLTAIANDNTTNLLGNFTIPNTINFLSTFTCDKLTTIIRHCNDLSCCWVKPLKEVLLFSEDSARGDGSPTHSGLSEAMVLSGCNYLSQLKAPCIHSTEKVQLNASFCVALKKKLRCLGNLNFENLSQATSWDLTEVLFDQRRYFIIMQGNSLKNLAYQNSAWLPNKGYAKFNPSFRSEVINLLTCYSW